MLGKRPLTIEALKDIKKEYVKNVGSRGGNVRIDQQTQEGGSLDFEDTGIDIEGQAVYNGHPSQGQDKRA